MRRERSFIQLLRVSRHWVHRKLDIAVRLHSRSRDARSPSHSLGSTAKRSASISSPRGVSRREFLPFCGGLAAVLGLGELAGPRVAGRSRLKRPTVIWLQLQECTGCVESVLRTADPTIGDLLLDLVSLDYSHTLMAAAGDAAERALADAMKSNAGKYLLVVTGSVPLDDERDLHHHRRPHREGRSSRRRRRAPRRSSRSAPAPTGAACRPRKPNPTGAVGVGDVIKDKPVVNIAGCPPIADVITATVVHYLTFGRLPALDGDGRPLFAYGARIHDQCPRRANFDAGQFVRGLRRRGGAQGLVPLPRGLQGAGDLLALPDLPVEQQHQLADRRRASVHRLHRAALLGHDDAVLRPPARRRRVRRRAARPTLHRRGPGGRRRRRRRGARRRHRRPPDPSAPARELPVIDAAAGPEEESSHGQDQGRRRSDHPHRGAPPDRGAGGERADHQRVGDLHAVPRHRDRSCRAATRATRGPSPSASAASAPWCTRSPRCRAVEDALDITIPPNANLIRNLVHGDAVHPGPRDPLLPPARARLGGRGERAQGRSGRHRRASRESISPWPNNSRDLLRARCRTGSRSSSAAASSGIFTNGYWGHPAYKLPPEVNLLAVAHYLEALDWQRDVIRLHTIFGGKNPHPNFLVGGMASRHQPRRHRARSTPSGSTDIQDMITRAQQFVEQVYWPDLLAIAGFYKEWGADRRRRAELPRRRRVPRRRRPRHRQALLPARASSSSKRPHQGPPVRSATRSRSTSPARGTSTPRATTAGLHPYEGETKAEVHRARSRRGRTCRTRRSTPG